jgi:hypothetical protein
MFKCAAAIVLGGFLGALSAHGAPAPSSGVCGNGVREGDEACDGTDLGGQTCTTVTSGFVTGGTLACGPDCKFDTTDCRRAFLASLIPARGGAPKNRCQLEWGTVGTTAKPGQITKRQCSDGDAECDQDKQFDNMCTFRIQMCLNVPDPKVPGCAFVSGGGKVIRVDVLAPKLGSTLGQQVASGVLAAAKGLAGGANGGAGTTAHLSNGSVGYSPPVTDFACGSSTIRIPLRGTSGHAKPGKVTIRARSSDNSGKIRATGVLTLICNP